MGILNVDIPILPTKFTFLLKKNYVENQSIVSITYIVYLQIIKQNKNCSAQNRESRLKFRKEPRILSNLNREKIVFVILALTYQKRIHNKLK